MRTIIISQPKAGTYLCANILMNLGLKFTWKHLGDLFYDHYDPDKLEEGRQYPERFRHFIPLKDSISTIKENEFAVSHIRYSKQKEILLKNFKKVILYRDPIEAAYSWNLFLKETKREGEEVTYMSPHVKQWFNRPGTLKIPFNALINKDISYINNLQNFLFNDIIYNSLEVMDKSLLQPSLTKSSKRQD